MCPVKVLHDLSQQYKYTQKSVSIKPYTVFSCLKGSCICSQTIKLGHSLPTSEISPCMNRGQEQDCHEFYLGLIEKLR